MIKEEIEKLRKETEWHFDEYTEGYNDALDDVLSVLRSSEENMSKDLEKEFDKCCENHIFDDECEVYTARKFFELGFKAQKGD